MDIKDLEIQVKKLGEETQKVLDKAEGQKDDNQKMNEDTKSELTALVLKEHEANEEAVKHLKTLQEQCDGLDTEMQARRDNEPIKKESFKDLLMGLEGSDNYKAFLGSDRKAFTLDLKADMLTSTHYTGDVIEPDRVLNTPVFSPERMIRMRDMIPGGNMSGGLISYPQEGTVVDNTASVGEGAAKPQNEFPVEQIESSAKKIAAYVRISDEALTDVPFMASYLSRRLIDKLKNVEDAQILYGTGVGTNLDGIFTQATTFAGNVLNQPKFDVLRKAIGEARASEFFANAILLNPADAVLLDIAKSATDGHYLVPSFVTFRDGRMFIGGVPIIESTFVTADDFIVGDFAKGAQLFDRLAANVRFFEQDATNVTTNKITIRVEERLALAVYHTGAFIASDFTTAQAA